MGAKLDLQSIQSMNIFSRLTGVRTQACFTYNRTLFFIVEPRASARAIGEKGANVKRLGLMLRQRVRVIPESNIENFARMIVQPVTFKSLTVDNEGYATISAGQQAKASLIGRDKVRIMELADILKQHFNIKGLRVI
jgi:NusA-like KH domain protein